MFDFLKLKDEIYREYNNVESNDNNGESTCQNIKEDKTFIEKFTDAAKSKLYRTLIYLCGILYLFMAGANSIYILRTGFQLIVLKYIVLMTLAVAGMILISTKKHTLKGLIICALFVILNMTTTFI